MNDFFYWLGIIYTGMFAFLGAFFFMAVIVHKISSKYESAVVLMDAVVDIKSFKDKP